MTELIDRVVSQVGIDRPIAEKAVGIILDFLSKEGAPEKVQALLARLPGHETLIADAAGESGGMFASMGGIMGVGSRLMGLGLGMGEIQNVIRELMAYAREQGAGDALTDIAASIPGLSAYI
jgi:hypothetical protein